MKFFMNLIKKFNVKDPKKILGRWNIDDCNMKINRKIDYSNEDHCGPCGNHTILKPNIENNLSNVIILDKKKK